MKKRELLTVVIFAVIKGAVSQIVKVDKEVVSKPGETFQLRCRIEGTTGITLTQVSWAKEPAKGKRENIAVFNPLYGPTYPTSSLQGRVSFISASLSNPSISVSNAVPSDVGSYVCEYTTYPTGTEQAVTKLIMLAKPKNSGGVVTVPVGTVPVVVARCQSAGGQPDPFIYWDTSFGGKWTNVSKLEANNTLTVTSEYWLVPTAKDNGKAIACVINHRAQDKPENINMKLNVEYPPTVSIQGYDDSWYLGRTNVELVCLADGNPWPKSVKWTATSGEMPKAVKINANKLTVEKVDETVNITFTCEVNNTLGSGKSQVNISVLEKPRPLHGSTTGSIIGVIIGLLILGAVIITAVLLFCRRKRKAENADEPPNYKPPPPTRTTGSTEMIHTMTAESQPLDVYYDTRHEPITDLDRYDEDDEENIPNGDSVVPLEANESSRLSESNVADSYFDPRDNHQENSGAQEMLSTISHGDSFISSAVLV